ncbi:general transcription factor II-I repeat domain-containing protein 2-like isoform X2 [Narcine bancroftii]|uniref:general transcription factor II-I repeat domain-containing protein 2-like isoform X2 n=1 Tax=Narcine bancroftii TaxID=1343680 RepID=UPI003831DE19
MSKRPSDTSMGNSDMKKRKRLSLSIAQKVKLLEKLDSGVSVKRLTEEYGVGTTTIYDLKKQKDKLLKFYSESDEQKLMKNRKTLHKGKNEELERVLMKWIRQRRSERIPLNGMVIMKQAKIYHDELKIEGNCEYSAGWLTKFKKRHGIKSFDSTQQVHSETSEDSEVEVTIEGNVAQVRTTPVIQEEPSRAENLLAVKFLMSALESMCQEIAKSKAEVACIAVYEKDIFVVGTEGGKSFIGNRKDFQTDFVKYCVTEEKKAAQKRGNKSLPSVTPTAMDNQDDTEKIRKSVEDLFCTLYGKAVGKPAPIPVPYEKIFEDPAAVAIHGLPDGVCFNHPSKYDTTALKKILEQKSKMIFTIKRPFLNTTIQHVETKQPTGKENVHMPPDSFVAVQVKTEPYDDNQPSTSVEPILIKAEAEDPDYYRYSVQVETKQSTGKENAHMPPDSFVTAQVKTEPHDDNQPSTSIPIKAEVEDPDYYKYSVQGTSIEPFLIKTEVEDPDYYRYIIQGGELRNEAHVASDETEGEFTADDSTQQEHSETSEDSEVEVTIEDDYYFPPNNQPKNTVQTMDAGQKSREFNFDAGQWNARITDLRKQVEELFERKYAQATLATGSVVIPYPLFQSNSEDLCVDGLPEGIPFRRPSNYGIPSLERILQAKDRIKFVIKSMATKCRKIDAECRRFQETWTENYFFLQHFGKPVCLICNESVAVNKEFNIKRHYETKHAKFKELSGQARVDEVWRLKESLEKQSSFFTKKNVEMKRNIHASYAVSKLIAEKMKPFTDGDFVKECLMAVVDIVCPENKSLFSAVNLSQRTVTRRIEEMSADIKSSLKVNCENFQFFSIALVESTDLKDSAQLAVFVRGIRSSFDIVEEFVKLIPLKDTVTGTDIFEVLKKMMADMKLDLSKLVGITTDGAPAMALKREGTIALLQRHMNDLGISHNVNTNHCIIHQEALCAKSPILKSAMDIVVKAVHLILSHGLNHHQFQQLLLEAHAEYGDLAYFCNVCWLSRGTMLEKVFALHEEVATFLENNHEDASHFRDPDWLSGLAFLVDVTSHLNNLNLQLQGKNQLVHEMYAHVVAFEAKLRLWESQFKKSNFAHFPNLQRCKPTDLDTFVTVLHDLKNEFSSRFADFCLHGSDFKLFATPFSVNVETVPEIFQIELIEMQCSDQLKSKFNADDVSLIDFYKKYLLPYGNYKNLVEHAKKMASLFGSTYVCEQLFSKMKYVKNHLRTNMTNGHLNDILLLASTTISPNIEMLSKNKVSH